MICTVYAVAIKRNLFPMQKRVQRSEIFRFYPSENVYPHWLTQVEEDHMQHRNCLLSIMGSRRDWCALNVHHLLKPAALLLICKSHVYYCLLIKSVLSTPPPPSQPFTPWQNVEVKFAYIRKLDVLAYAIFTGVSVLWVSRLSPCLCRFPWGLHFPPPSKAYRCG